MIKILFFASLKEQFLIDSLDFPLAASLTVNDLIIELEKTESSIKQGILSAEDILVAVNQTVVSKDFSVNPGNEVAFFPPVTGG